MSTAKSITILVGSSGRQRIYVTNHALPCKSPTQTMLSNIWLFDK
jgi:hypothetical protein